jgi:hypothetical protein
VGWGGIAHSTYIKAGKNALKLTKKVQIITKAFLHEFLPIKIAIEVSKVL